MKILLVEDDEMIGESLKVALKKSNYSLDWVQDGDDVELSLETGNYDLIILDLGLPNKDGIDILKTLRSQDNPISVLILMARDGVEDRVLGLDTGADDYMLKPFSLEELEARIRLLLRRREGRKTNVIRHGELSLNIDTHKVIYKGENHTLSAKEFNLLVKLTEKSDNVFSREQLEDILYGWNEEVQSNAVEVHIHQIRKKLGKEIIRNTRNVGYSLGI